ncbi:2-succinyl-5-enolpyruvyl-6-hydroxy-3-cyclohexene-1-carboxylic-acid synthase [Dyadobacter sp. CY323]|uniref:2-succinyl-5-enolpyruvyl-6-hydroxy-3- cyclohexene-1-carboxylic-acid synthase n=1 Tax=Dyadobacter sp. CY323 TaxID=2907302 RepID=UPI001F27B59C|nr:2-succinyl-5-enolpyruvyl-6-hydroxy-3-cyclohexene-1-carboxylic-acid synthase [Dyadobacter sp. CY323]MCE6992178.1 2-succinyl-5-enolpyruvyl-6-hydroxy-3-cyclohexene-1-carboxylic-acid synthase [Dyadobacter sp. CY323]
MAILQPLIDIATICHAHGVRHVVISPGSRSAALTLAFARHQGFETHVCMDERSAGFIALGIAQQLNVPVVLICTSGSAAYNFAPAVTEAFFQQVPLVVLTADRPKEWTHQLDGQTIYQSEIYGKHVKRAFELSPDYQHADVVWAINRIANEAVNLAGTAPAGPVHINIPIREPFYPSESESFFSSGSVRQITRTNASPILDTETWHELLDEWDGSGKILIAGGQARFDKRLNDLLDRINEEWDIPVVADCISNLPGTGFIRNHDLFLSSKRHPDASPDLLITFGLSFISKDLKLFLRNNPPLKHWHIGLDTFLSDPTQSITRQIPVRPDYFFEMLYEKIDYQLFVQNSDPENSTDYAHKWQRAELEAADAKQKYLGNLTQLNDLTSLDKLFLYIKNDYQLHIANSMSIRYANVLTLPNTVSEVFANRGTSGIDGCVSTAIGAAKVNGKPTLLIVGDVAFLYDRNGLLINDLPENLKIVVLNNAGGNIFRMIDGPAGLPELETFFETRHSFSARRTCKDSGISYFDANNLQSLETTVQDFLNKDGISLLEIFTDPVENEKAWKGLRQLSKSSAFY